MTDSSTDTVHEPESLEALQELIKQSDNIRIVDNPKGPSFRGSQCISLTKFNRILEYDPGEYTITVEAGVSVKSVQETLATKSQYLPFDPPFLDDHTSIGSMIARGYSGPGSNRYGILRDFILGVTFVDGLGDLIHTGGKVVKNAAGFDIPKLMVGSGGSFGVIVSASFKVFPLPLASRDLVFTFSDFEEGHAALVKLGRSCFTLDALDLTPQGELFIRIAGTPASLAPRIESLEALLNQSSIDLSHANESPPWDLNSVFGPLMSQGLLVKIATTPTGIADLNSALAPTPATCRYSIGGQVAWIHWTGEPSRLTAILESLSLSAQTVSPPEFQKIIGVTPQRLFYDRVKRAFDPDDKFIHSYSPDVTSNR